MGDAGITNLERVDTGKAEKEFNQTIRAKQRKGYAVIKMNLGEKKDTKQVDIDSGDYAPSKLHPQVQDFVKLIYNKNLMELAVAANGYDIKKLPLGDLSAETIQKGYEVLSEIEKAINKKQTALLRDLCGKFYTYIPHNFGRQKMENFIIDNEDKLKDKQELI